MNWPRQTACNSFYGNPRLANGKLDPHWYAENIIQVSPPFAMHMDMAPIKHFPVHRKCAKAFGMWLDKVWTNAGHDQAVIAHWGMDVFSGSFEFRPMRGSTHLSMHAYGCAMDLDAPRNGFHSHSPHFAEFKAQVVQPFLALGGEWGGNWPNSTDGMHFQFARVG